MKTVPGRNGGTLINFEKGESGNPKGRPRKLPEIDDLLAEVLGEEEGDEAREILHALLKKAKRGDVRAAEVLLDRAYGKAKQDITQRTTIEDKRKDLSNLTDDDISTLERIYAKIGDGKSSNRESQEEV